MFSRDRWRRRRAVPPETYTKFCEILLASERTVVLTGAGVSTGSGIPDFRSPESGLWQRDDPIQVASIWGFREEPGRFYRWIRPLAQKLMTAQPNAAHRALAQLEDLGLVDLIITQNIDHLHQRAGSKEVVQVHGRAGGAVCLACRHEERDEAFWRAYLEADASDLPTCPLCGSVLKPDVVLFGEELPHAELRRAQQAALHCDLMLVVGTSLEVMPAADLPLLACRRGARLAVLNLGGTTVDHRADVVIHEDVTVSLPRVAAMCGAALSE